MFFKIYMYICMYFVTTESEGVENVKLLKIISLSYFSRPIKITILMYSTILNE